MIWSALSLPSRKNTLRCRLLPFGTEVHSKPMMAVKRPGSLYFSAAAVIRFHAGWAMVCFLAFERVVQLLHRGDPHVEGGSLSLMVPVLARS